MRPSARSSRREISASGTAQARRRRSARSRALDRELYEAAQAGDFEGVKEMVEAGANPSAKIDGDGSPLIGAARSGRSEITKFLLDQGADPNGVVEGDGSPLITAAAARPARSGADADRSRRRREPRGRGRREPVDGRRRARQPARSCSCSSRRAPTSTRASGTAGADATIGEWRTAISQARKNGHTAVVRYPGVARRARVT